MPARFRASDLIGVPVVPPAAASRGTTRLRAAAASLLQLMVPPPLSILESLFGLVDHAAMVAFVELGIPDQLAVTRTMSVAELAEALPADADSLERLVRYAAMRGWLRIDRRGRIAPNRVTRFLTAGHPGGWRAWVDFMGGAEVTAASRALAAAIRQGGDGFHIANGEPFFDWMARHRDRGAAFDAAMSAGGRMHGLVLAHALDWSNDRTVCDVGGGSGALLEVLLASHDHLSGIVLDLPEVVNRAGSVATARLTRQAGDAFVALPPEASTYLFVNVVHDWSDEDATRMLRRAATDGPRGARVVVVEGVRRAVPIDDVAQRTDLLMLLLAPGGRERTAAEIEAVGVAAGLAPSGVVPLATGDAAYVFTI